MAQTGSLRPCKVHRATYHSFLGLEAGLQRFLLGYAGALLVLTPLGTSVMERVSTDEETAHLLGASALSVAICMIPWQSVFASLLCRFGLDATSRVATLLKVAILPSLLLLAALAMGMEGAAALPDSYRGVFWKFHLSVAAIGGALVSFGLAFILDGVKENWLQSRLRREHRLLRIGQVGSLIPRLLGVTTMIGYQKTMDQVFLEGLGVVEYQLFSFCPADGTFQFNRGVGRMILPSRGFTFRRGEPHILGQVAELGGHMIQETSSATKRDHSRVEPPVPTVFCLAIQGDSGVCEVYNISRMRDPEGIRGLANQIQMLTVVAGRALSLVLASTASSSSPPVDVDPEPPRSSFDPRSR